MYHHIFWKAIAVRNTLRAYASVAVGIFLDGFIIKSRRYVAGECYKNTSSLFYF